MRQATIYFKKNKEKNKKDKNHLHRIDLEKLPILICIHFMYIFDKTLKLLASQERRIRTCFLNQFKTLSQFKTIAKNLLHSFSF